MNKFSFFFMASIITSLSLKGQCDIRMYDIYTPIGSEVVTFLTCEASTPDRVYYDDYYSSAYPNAEKIIVYDDLSSTRKFNCHGYAWLRVEQGIDRWIGTGWDDDIEDPEWIYVTDGSYIQVSSETFPGKVFWASGDHTAITTEQQGWFISKWSQWPLFRHKWDDTPFGTANLEYYVKNCHLVIENDTITTDRNIVSCGDIEVKNVFISNEVNINIVAQDAVVLKPGSHAIASSNVRISIGNSDAFAPTLPQSPYFSNPNTELSFDAFFSQNPSTNQKDIELNRHIFKLFPNPNSGTFQLETNFLLSDITNLKVMDMLGVTVYESKNISSNLIHLENSAAGFYCVVIILKDGTVLTEKMMIQR